MTPIRTPNRVLRTARATWLQTLCALALVATTGCGADAGNPAGPESTDDDDSSDGDDDDKSDKPVSTKDSGTKKPTETTDEPADGKPVAKPDAGSTKPATTADAGAGTVTKGGATWCDVKPIVTKKCNECHDGEGSSGSPMGLTKASDFAAMAVVSKGKTVAQAVSARTHDTTRPMPPKGVLVGTDIETLDAWLAAGAPAGDDDTCATTGGTEPGADGKIDGWNPEECDKIYELRSHGTGTAPYNVPPGQEVHPQIALDAPWGTETVQAIGFKPYTDNKKVLHHWILNGAGRTFLAGWAPGDDARPPFPKDVGMSMPTGKGAFTLDMHYNSLNEKSAAMDASGVDICVLKGANLRPKIAAVTMGFASIGTGGVLAPAGAKNAPVTGTCNVTASQPVHLLTAAPHAHTYARHMKFTVTKKDKTEIVMHDADFAFGEQGTYPLPGGEVILETGDVVKTTCYYTNDTARNITFSESTTGEMCFNFALYYPKGALNCGGGLGF